MHEFLVRVQLKEPLNMSWEQAKNQVEEQLRDDSVFEKVEVTSLP